MTLIEIMSAAHDAEYARWCAFVNSPLDALDTQLWGNPRLDTQRWAERDRHGDEPKQMRAVMVAHKQKALQEGGKS